LALDYRKPKSFFQSYLYFSKKFKRFRTKPEFLNEKEIEKLKNKYTDWEVYVWNTKLIKENKIKFTSDFKNKTFNLTQEQRIEEIKIKTSPQKWVYTISKPFYNKNHKKAFLIISTEIKYNHHTGGLGIAKMKKIKGKWKYIGNAPIY